MHAGRDDEDDERDDDEVGSEADPAPKDSSSAAPVNLEVNGYQLVEELTRGGQAVIFLAIQKSTGRKVALKLMFKGPFASEVDRQRVDQEVRILAALDHPNIVSVIDRGETADGSPYFVMNYVDGRSLNEFLDDFHNDHGGPADLPDVGDLLKLFKRICEAVNAAHLRGIVHRDLKPANIIIDTYGEPHILDFGLAHAAVAQGGSPAQSPTRTGEFVGSLEWASPEQARGEAGKIDTRTDVYALGVILYELLTGDFPYDVFGELREVLDHIVKSKPLPPSRVLQAARDGQTGPRTAGPLPLDAALDAIVLKALAKSRDERYQTAGELARDLGQYLEGRRTQLRPARRPLHRLLPVAITLGLVAVIGAYLGRAHLRRQPSELVVPYEQGIFGYALLEDTVCFVFEPARYDRARHEDGRLMRVEEAGAVDSVQLVGAFNEWKRDDPAWRMRKVKENRFELRKPIALFSGRSEWPFKFILNGHVWVGAPANAANREVVVTDTATFNLVLANPGAGDGADTETMRLFREQINRAWPGQGANLARDEKLRYHLTFSHLPPGLRITDLEPLRGIPLSSLDLGEAKVTDLSPLQDMATLTRLRVNDGTFQNLTTDIMAGLRRGDYEGAEQATLKTFAAFSKVPAFVEARDLILESVRSLSVVRLQPGALPPQARAFQGHHYALVIEPMSWSDARFLAEAAGGHLASVTSPEENTWLAQTFGQAALGRSLWLGGTDENTESFWRWQNGEGWRFEHWDKPEPNNNGGSEHSLAVKPDGWWIDADGFRLHLPFVIEWDR